MLLGERWQRVDGWHGTNMAEPEWAADYVRESGDLWRRRPGSAVVLKHWWTAEPVRAWRASLDEAMVRLQNLPAGDQRSVAVHQRHALQDARAVAEVVKRTVAAGE